MKSWREYMEKFCPEKHEKAKPDESMTSPQAAGNRTSGFFFAASERAMAPHEKIQQGLPKSFLARFLGSSQPASQCLHWPNRPKNGMLGGTFSVGMKVPKRTWSGSSPRLRGEENWL
ncbi:MAG: hypothetical protein IIC13_01795 [SAR324 cluster bacterium]|nr:hypothetical protein [SAR324 cluster bacterium]